VIAITAVCALILPVLLLVPRSLIATTDGQTLALGGMNAPRVDRVPNQTDQRAATTT
jgi:hypothetical protein